MPAMTVRNISDAGHAALKRRAKLHGKSAEAEVRAMLDALAEPQQLADSKQEVVGFGTKLHQIFHKHGVTLPEYVRDKTPLEPAIFE
jgi:plasmid stability protein